MRDQYAGDVSDFLKFALLRRLAGTERTLGVAWYYVPGNDGRPDGRHLEWRDDHAWQKPDAELHAGLSALPERSVAALENVAIWPNGTLFHREPVPPRRQRGEWGKRKRAAWDGADIVFLDPDNGIGRETRKHATLSEIRLLRRPERTIVFITFPGRSMPHDALLEQLHARVRGETGAQTVFTLRTIVSVPGGESVRTFVPRLRWFTIVDPDEVVTHQIREFIAALANVPRVSVHMTPAAIIEAARSHVGTTRNAASAPETATSRGDLPGP